MQPFSCTWNQLNAVVKCVYHCQMHQLALPKKDKQTWRRTFRNTIEEEEERKTQKDLMRSAYFTSIYWAVSEILSHCGKI